MDDNFLRSIAKIDTSDPSASAESVMRIFMAISNLDKSGVIAAYHTYRFYFQNRKKQDPVTENRIDLIESALRTRMKHLCAETPKAGRRAIALAFTSAMGDPFHMIIFKNIIDSP